MRLADASPELRIESNPLLLMAGAIETPGRLRRKRSPPSMWPWMSCALVRSRTRFGCDSRESHAVPSKRPQRSDRIAIRGQERREALRSSFPRDILSQPPIPPLLRLTVILLLMHGAEVWYVAIPIRIVGVLALLSPRVLVHPGTWLALLAAMAWGNAAQWYVIDSHKHLMIYWTGTCALAVASTAPVQVLHHNARFLIALSFTFAMLWKLFDPEFLDGSSLSDCFLTDPRVEGVSAALWDFPRAPLFDNRALLGLASIAPQAGLALQMDGAERRAPVAQALAVWTIAIEGAIAVAFWWKESPLGLHVRNSLFLATTYPVLPGVGFAFVLAVLGSASSSDHERWRAVFALTAVAVCLVAIPWQSLLA